MSQLSYPVGKCYECGKRCFLSRKAARGYVRKFHSKQRYTVYQCGEYWHYGRATVGVRLGTEPRKRVPA